MPRRISCRIIDRPDGRFDVMATLEPDKTFCREGFVSLAEAEECVEFLRTLMTACGAPLINDSPSQLDRPLVNYQLKHSADSKP